jgi:S1-C subfamily serine protease
MVICQACSAEIIGRDRFCRKCGTPVTASVTELDDTRRFNPQAQPSAAAQPGRPDATYPFYAPPPVAYPRGPGAPGYQTGAVKKDTSTRKIIWLVVILILAIFIGTGVIVSVQSWRSSEAARTERVRRSTQEAIKNALGFEMGSFSDAEFPGIKGVFVEVLASDDSPAALAGIQAGDVLMELNDQAVRNSNELGQVLDQLKPGLEANVKLYRDEEVKTVRIKVADPAFTVPTPRRREVGFFGVSDVGNRRRVPGTNKWGVAIGSPTTNNPADLAGMQRGDIITEFDGHPIRTSREFSRRIRAAEPRKKILVKFYRGNVEQTVEVTMGHNR